MTEKDREETLRFAIKKATDYLENGAEPLRRGKLLDTSTLLAADAELTTAMEFLQIAWTLAETPDEK